MPSSSARPRSGKTARAGTDGGQRTHGPGRPPLVRLRLVREEQASLQPSVKPRARGRPARTVARATFAPPSSLPHCGPERRRPPGAMPDTRPEP